MLRMPDKAKAMGVYESIQVGDRDSDELELESLMPVRNLLHIRQEQ